MGKANVISMIAQPVSSSYLCFEIGGILDTRSVGLGDAVASIAYGKLVDLVKGSGAVAGDPSRLAGDANGIVGIAEPFSLASLRNEDRRTSLNSAVNSRQNIYFSKYANAALVISAIRGAYGTAAASNPARLDRLADLANEQLVALSRAYQEDERTGVVKATTSTTSAKGTSSGEGYRASKFHQESIGLTWPGNSTVPRSMPIPWEGYSEDNVWGNGGYPSRRVTKRSPTQTAITDGVNFEENNNVTKTTGRQTSTHVDYEYRTPLIEARARAVRAQISLTNQKFESYMFSQNIPHLETIFANELASIDNDVYQLQIALLRSYLISPIEGVVTGVFKNPGDAVSAGEPVLRVEDNGTVHLVASLAHKGAIRTGATATVSTTLAGAGGGQTDIDGTVVSSRGQNSGTRWEVVIQLKNLDAGGNTILPLGYVFDPEYTAVSIV